MLDYLSISFCRCPFENCDKSSGKSKAIGYKEFAIHAGVMHGRIAHCFIRFLFIFHLQVFWKDGRLKIRIARVQRNCISCWRTWGKMKESHCQRFLTFHMKNFTSVSFVTEKTKKERTCLSLLTKFTKLGTIMLPASTTPDCKFFYLHYYFLLL